MHIVDDEQRSDRRATPMRPSGSGFALASAALPLLDDGTASPASRRLASARPALAPKCELILARTLSAGFRTGLYYQGGCQDSAHGRTRKNTENTE